MPGTVVPDRCDHERASSDEVVDEDVEDHIVGREPERQADDVDRSVEQPAEPARDTHDDVSAGQHSDRPKLRVWRNPRDLSRCRGAVRIGCTLRGDDETTTPIGPGSLGDPNDASVNRCVEVPHDDRT